MNPRRQIKRANLFVLRIWTEEMDDPDEAIKWQGQVRRAVDGEAHHFDGLQGLLDWLTHNLEGNTTVRSSKFGSVLSAGQAETERRSK